MQLLMKPEEAATALGISRASCYVLLTSGELPSVKVGSSVRIPLAALQRWIETHTTSSSATELSGIVK
jgi:excisionase family DNA binding protein